MYRCRPLLATILTIISIPVASQTKLLYSYQDLSHVYYQKQKDSLTKTWICPVIYKEKNTQKKYKEIWDERTLFLIRAIENDNYVHDNEVYSYVDGIITQLVQANKQMIPVKPLLLIDRSSSDEWLASEDYQQSLNAVLDSKYERLSRLKKVLENYSFSRSKHQRYHESDADSLAIILLKKSNLAFNADFFLRLDSSDIIYQHPLKNPVKQYFTTYNLPFEDSWIKKRSKGLSTKAYSFKDTSGIQDSLKTHPECVARYNKTRSQTVSQATYNNIPAAIHDKANKMLIWNMYSNMSLTPCLYRIFMEKDNGNTDEWYDFMIHNIITGLYYADREMHRFNAIGVTQKEAVSRDYYELQTMLEQIPR
jgi:hypothetical protein